jgi:energy-coupling factor transporter ATP-binding protein EcfA2
LDEPFSMLDITAAADFIGYIEKQRQRETAVIIFEHRTELLNPVSNLRRISLNGKNLGGGHLQGVTQNQPDFQSCSDPVHLSVVDLTVRISGQTILDQLNFEAHGGQTIAIVGKNGSGKTTLLRTLAGLQQHAGQILSQDGPPEFALVYQNADLQLFNATVRNEILHRVSNPDWEYYQQLLRGLGLERYEATPPLLLSEGEKKRVALASVLMHQPRDGILLDEPSLGQDGRHKAILIRLAKSLNRAGQLVVMTTHDLTLASQADCVLLLGEGKIISQGPPEHIFQQAAAWEKIGLYVPKWANPWLKEGER